MDTARMFASILPSLLDSVLFVTNKRLIISALVIEANTLVLELA